MSNDYTRPKHAPFPHDLAERIARKAVTLASRFEDHAVKQMVRDAQRALDRGVPQAEIIREMGLR
jgi:hypothetical protein